MPQRDIRAYLYDVVESCRVITEYAEGHQLETFIADGRTRDAIERRLANAGEAISHIRRMDRTVADELGDVDRIVSFRNILVHGYFLTKPEMVWKIVTQHVPALHVAAKRTLATFPPPEVPPPE